MKVIGIIGQKAAGKTTIADYIAKKIGAKVHRYAEILDDVLNVLNLPITNINEIKLVGLRDVFGENTLPRALRKKITEENSPTVIITSIRFQNELDDVRAYAGSKVIYVESDIQVRFKRMQGRNQKADDTSISFEQFVSLEADPTEKYIKKLGDEADFKVINNGSEQELFTQVDAILQQLI
ncbi:AAA family ATPase [Patescibacteria group bacterium]|nr:AAA family ATPase [Patescibacteria group bacterium]